MKERLLRLGAEPTRLYEKFRQRAEAQGEEQDDRVQAAEARLTESIEASDSVSLVEYRASREAAQHLIAEPDLPIDEMCLADYRKMREAQQRGENKPQSYGDYLRQREGSEERG